MEINAEQLTAEDAEERRGKSGIATSELKKSEAIMRQLRHCQLSTVNYRLA